jgi:hypothetical protein
LGGDNANNVVFIPRMGLDSGLQDSPIPFHWLQFPIHLAYAMTINKSQGQMVKHVGLNLSTSVFLMDNFMWLYHIVLIPETSKFSFLMVKNIQKQSM